MRDSGLISCRKIISVAPSPPRNEDKLSNSEGAKFHTDVLDLRRGTLEFGHQSKTTSNYSQAESLCACAGRFFCWYPEVSRKHTPLTPLFAQTLLKHTQSTERNIPETTSTSCCTNAWNEATSMYCLPLFGQVEHASTLLLVPHRPTCQPIGSNQ